MSLTPFDRIRQAYIDRPEDVSFEALLLRLMACGFVHSTPDFFVAGFRVSRDRLVATGNPWDSYDQKNGDCWYVVAMAGDVAKAWSVLPRPLPWVGWHRDRDTGKDLHIHPLSQICRVSGGIQATSGGFTQ